jgi:hypothetical protein
MKTKTKKKIKKQQVIAFVIILVCGVAAIAGLLLHALRVTAETEQPFVHERRHNAQRLYRETIGRDILENYPQTPRELMEAYGASVWLLYGEFIATEDMFMQVIEFQRTLFSHELRQSITADEQFNNLMASIAEMSYAGVLARRPEIEEIAFDFIDQRSALVEVRHRFTWHDNLYRLYYVVMDENDLWRIASWALADSDFNLLEISNE